MIKVFKKEILIDGKLEKTSYTVQEIIFTPPTNKTPAVEQVKWTLDCSIEDANELLEKLSIILKK